MDSEWEFVLRRDKMRGKRRGEAKKLSDEDAEERLNKLLVDSGERDRLRDRAFGGLAAPRLQPENFPKIRAGWPYSEPRLIQLERLVF